MSHVKFMYSFTEWVDNIDDLLPKWSKISLEIMIYTIVIRQDE